MWCSVKERQSGVGSVLIYCEKTSESQLQQSSYSSWEKLEEDFLFWGGERNIKSLLHHILLFYFGIYKHLKSKNTPSPLVFPSKDKQITCTNNTGRKVRLLIHLSSNTDMKVDINGTRLPARGWVPHTFIPI